MTREVMQQALEAWQTRAYGSAQHYSAMMVAMTEVGKAILAQPVQQEQQPVAWRYPRDYGHCDLRYWLNRPSEGYRLGEEPLYTSPPQRKWVGLTVVEYAEICRSSDDKASALIMAEDLLKENNT